MCIGGDRQTGREEKLAALEGEELSEGSHLSSGPFNDMSPFDLSRADFNSPQNHHFSFSPLPTPKD